MSKVSELGGSPNITPSAHSTCLPKACAPPQLAEMRLPSQLPTGTTTTQATPSSVWVSICPGQEPCTACPGTGAGQGLPCVKALLFHSFEVLYEAPWDHPRLLPPLSRRPPESRSLTLDVAVQGDHARPLGAAERGVVDVLGQGGGEARGRRPRGRHRMLRRVLFMPCPAVLKPHLQRQPRKP